MLFQAYLPKLKQCIGSKRYARLSRITMFLDETGNITSMYIRYRKNINGQKGEELTNYPHAVIETTPEYANKKSYHIVTLRPLDVSSYVL